MAALLALVHSRALGSGSSSAASVQRAVLGVQHIVRMALSLPECVARVQWRLRDSYLVVVVVMVVVVVVVVVCRGRT